MTKLEFIEWLERFTCFQEDFTKDNCWKEIVEIDLNWYDYIQIEDDLVIFK